VSESDLWKLVILESPFKGVGKTDAERKASQNRNVKYARACMRDCLLREEAPYASHLLYTQPGVLDDAVALERLMGMEAGFAWGGPSAYVVVYCDLGISDGMRKGIARAEGQGREVFMRTLDTWSDVDHSSPEIEVDWNTEKEPLYFRYWSRCEDIAMHFNELAVKFRLQALAGLVIAGTITAAAVKGGLTTSWALVGGGLAALAVMWLAVAAIDAFYYGRLLRGAVEELEDLERRLGPDGFQISTKIEHATRWSLPRSGQSIGEPSYSMTGAALGRWVFYLLPFIALSYGSCRSYRMHDEELGQRVSEPSSNASTSRSSGLMSQE